MGTTPNQEVLDFLQQFLGPNETAVGFVDRSIVATDSTSPGSTIILHLDVVSKEKRDPPAPEPTGDE